MHRKQPSWSAVFKGWCPLPPTRDYWGGCDVFCREQPRWLYRGGVILPEPSHVPVPLGPLQPGSDALPPSKLSLQLSYQETLPLLQPCNTWENNLALDL